MNVLVQHIPHAIPVVLVWGLLVRFWLAQRRLERGGDLGEAQAPPPAAAPTSASAARPAPAVRRSVAARGLIALGPLIGALGTGLVIYALNLGRGHAGQTAIWVHVGLSLLALLLVIYKVAEIGFARLRDSIVRARSWRAGGSLVLLVLWVPLLVSGVALLIAPSEASFTAYAHLIASVWWTGLLLWHLRRYLVRATRAVLAPPAAAPSVVAADRAAARRARPPAPRRRPAGRGARGTPTELPPPSGQSVPIGGSKAAGVAVEDGARAPAHRR